jgi:hypothetical protein
MSPVGTLVLQLTGINRAVAAATRDFVTRLNLDSGPRAAGI